MINTSSECQNQTTEEKKRDLYFRQKELLDTFLERGAISQIQHDWCVGSVGKPAANGVERSSRGLLTRPEDAFLGNLKLTVWKISSQSIWRINEDTGSSALFSVPHIRPIVRYLGS